MKKLIFLFIALIFFCSVEASLTPAQTNKLSIEVTDKRKVFTRSISKDLLLRVVKDSSVKQKDFCWIVEVVRKPYRKSSTNLIYSNKTGVTADPSQVCAWQVPEKYFPNERELPVRGFPYTIKIALLNPETKGNESDAGFVSGTLEITWTRR